MCCKEASVGGHGARMALASQPPMPATTNIQRSTLRLFALNCGWSLLLSRDDRPLIVRHHTTARGRCALHPDRNCAGVRGRTTHGELKEHLPCGVFEHPHLEDHVHRQARCLLAVGLSVCHLLRRAPRTLYIKLGIVLAVVPLLFGWTLRPSYHFATTHRPNAEIYDRVLVLFLCVMSVRAGVCAWGTNE